MILKFRKIFILILFFVFLCIIPIISAEDLPIIKYPVGITSKVTASNEEGVEVETRILYWNSFEEQALVFSDIPISEIFRNGNGIAYGTNLPDGSTIPDKKYYHAEGIIEPHKSHEIIFKTFIEKVSKNVSSDKTKIEFTASVFENISYNRVEFWVPIIKGLDKLQPIQCSVAPISRYDSSEYRILTFDNQLHHVVSVEYYYEFSWMDFFTNPWLLLFIGGVFGFGLERIYNKKYKKRN